MKVIEGIDCSQSDVGEKLVRGLQGAAIEVVVYVAGILKPEVSTYQMALYDIEKADVWLWLGWIGVEVWWE